MNDKTNFYQDVTDKLIALFEKEQLFSVTWNESAPNDIFLPKNALSGVRYSGVNTLILAREMIEHGYAENRWMTINQAKAKGLYVNKGEKGTSLSFYKIVKTTDKNGEETTFPFLKPFSVFNIAQFQNWNVYEPAMPQESNVSDFIDHELAESFLALANIQHGGNSAFYQPSTDRIQMPLKSSFACEADYYNVAFHELGHWTGAAKRLKRDFGGRFGDESYAFEELIAELNSAFMCNTVGFQSKTDEQHAAYLKSWVRILKNDNKAIFTAAKEAQAAHDYIIKHAQALSMEAMKEMAA